MSPTLHPPNLMELARRCREVYNLACTTPGVGPDLCGCSLLDLCADNIPDGSLSDLEDAIVVSGIYGMDITPQRIKSQIVRYDHGRTITNTNA